ncbi:MAG: hypothetical protein F4X22_01635, partial [Gemmatimonadales bacterium]|nr:hypothetical protein [Candidatus Palauibacter denitrificans]
MKRVRATAAALLVGLAAGVAAGLALGGARAAAPDGSGEAADLLRGMAERQGQRLGQLAQAADESARLLQELALARFYRLQEFRRFGLEGQIVTWVVPEAPPGGAGARGGGRGGAGGLPPFAGGGAPSAGVRAR